jgi:Holliday junction DNA helicase RuvA
VIASLSGLVAFKDSSSAVLDVHGVGYRVSMTTGSLAALPPVGHPAMVHTFLQVREDALSLFGFADIAEKAAFEQLITVSGVGPKVALATLSTLSPAVLAEAIAAGDVTLVSGVPGIGKKTAQRIIVDLAGRLSSGISDTSDGGVVSSPLAEAREALQSMGFSSGEISASLKGATDEQGVQAVLQGALRRLGGGA